MDRKVVFALVLSALFIVSVGSVAADGLYWGDSVTEPVGDEPVITPGEDIPDDVAVIKPKKLKKLKKLKKDDFIFDEPEIRALTGLYWGD